MRKINLWSKNEWKWLFFKELNIHSEKYDWTEPPNIFLWRDKHSLTSLQDLFEAVCSTLGQQKINLWAKISQKFNFSKFNFNFLYISSFWMLLIHFVGCSYVLESHPRKFGAMLLKNGSPIYANVTRCCSKF